MTQPVGECHICGRVGPLTKEHVPPQKAFNTGSYLQVTPEVAFTTGPTEIPKGRTQQGGIFFHRTCNECNNRNGKWNVPEYLKWAHGGLSLIEGFPKGQRYVMVTAEKAYPLRLIKQFAAMFLTVNPLDFRHSPVGQALGDFVVDRVATGLPSEIRFFAYLNHEGQFRYLPLMGKINIFEGTICHMSEITHPPLGWVMTLNSESPDERLSELTNCADVPFNVNAIIEVLMHRLPTYIAISPGNYRALDELNEDERKSLEAELQERAEPLDQTRSSTETSPTSDGDRV